MCTKKKAFYTGLRSVTAHLDAGDELVAGQVAQRAAAVARQVVDVPGVRRIVAVRIGLVLPAAGCTPCNPSSSISTCTGLYAHVHVPSRL